MATELARKLSFFGPERVLIAILVWIDAAPLFTALLPIKVNARRIVFKNAFGSGNRVEAVVRMWIRDVVLQIDRKAIGRFDERRVHIAVDVAFFPFGIVFREDRKSV